jgi:hypothetical protein
LRVVTSKAHWFHTLFLETMCCARRIKKILRGVLNAHF